ncbi:DUF3667 domain-containing protein [Massilia sp. CFBP9026]|uniref:DUF3667 domain-containing protein n=1 Tax=Massilia sp. CFBP9026 TaxID=3096536 RepID=UPI002A6A7D74|nr:DUF3667 domain-containing protein [Massilia sp. CFBP9026]MDY0961688.1 DUF3667 domain-containing protein [Massilia sp. CFBP9026]
MSSHTLTDHASIPCKNCGTTTHGNYCQQCGQATHLHVPSAREFLHEFIAHYVALEGKLWKSLALLIARPGLLTCEYIEGRRVRYLEPLRLYLTFSIIFFALFKLSGVEVARFDEPSPALAAAVAEGRAKETVLGPAMGANAAEYEKVQAVLDKKASNVHPVLRERVARFMSLSPQAQRSALKQAFYSYTPYAIFAMMPLFALYLKILYLGTGRRYGEHFLFALHVNAFAFLMLSVMILVPETWKFITFALLLWLVFYLPMAMRRVYERSWVGTVVRWVVLIFAHIVTLASAVLTVMGMVLMG